jgi:hypothetical protein
MPPPPMIPRKRMAAEVDEANIIHSSRIGLRGSKNLKKIPHAKNGLRPLTYVLIVVSIVTVLTPAQSQ